MSRLLGALDDLLAPPAPAERLAMVRVLVGLYALVYLVVRTPHLLSYGDLPAHAFTPVGVVSVLSAPLPGFLAKALALACLPLAGAFAVGVRHRALAPLFGVTLLWVLTYSNSFGKILHTDNLLVLQVLVLAASPAAEAFSLDARRSPRPAGEDRRHGWALRLLALITVTVYFLAGVAKLDHGGLAFLEGDSLRNYVAFDNVRKLELGSIHSPLGAALLPYAGLFDGLAALSLVLELGAPLALAHRRVGSVWALGIWGFHVGVLLLMAIAFTYPLSGIALAPFFRVERLADRRPLRWVRRLEKVKSHVDVLQIPGERRTN